MMQNPEMTVTGTGNGSRTMFSGLDHSKQEDSVKVRVS